MLPRSPSAFTRRECHGSQFPGDLLAEVCRECCGWPFSYHRLLHLFWREDTSTTAIGQIRPGPVPHDRDADLKANQIEDMDSQPDNPGEEAGEAPDQRLHRRDQQLPGFPFHDSEKELQASDWHGE